jgi:hypothetical protein
MSTPNENHEVQDFSCEIDTELNKLIAFGDLMAATDPKWEFYDKTNTGLGNIIIGIAKNIQNMLDATYKSVHEHGKRAAEGGGA